MLKVDKVQGPVSPHHQFFFTQAAKGKTLQHQTRESTMRFIVSICNPDRLSQLVGRGTPVAIKGGTRLVN